MRMFLILVLISSPLFADALKCHEQVRQHLVDVGKLTSINDVSLDFEYEITYLGNSQFSIEWNEAVLGAKPVSWPDAEISIANLQNAQANAPEVLEKPALVSALTTAISDVYGLTPPYSKAQQAQYKTQMRADMNTYRQNVENASTLPAMISAQKELNKRQQIINLVREIEKLDPSWNLGDVE